MNGTSMEMVLNAYVPNEIWKVIGPGENNFDWRAQGSSWLITDQKYLR